MSINKKALTRYLAYDACLKNKSKRYTWKDLLNAANNALNEEGLEGIGKTQLYADLKYLEFSDWKAPIVKTKNGKTAYYSYEDPNYSIGSQPLNKSEVQQLQSALQVLSRFKGLPQFEWVHELVPTIQTKLGIIETDKEVIGFELNDSYEGLRHIDPLFKGIVNKKVFNVTYKDFKSPSNYIVTFHPYYLKQYNNRWFAFGFNPSNQAATWTLALDRIIKIEIADEEYRDSEIDWDIYFNNIIGVTKHNEEEVVVRILIKDKEQADYIRTKPLHQSQTPIVETALGFETGISVIPNYELEKLILSFGERIEVTSPIHLRKRIKEKFQIGYLNYGND